MKIILLSILLSFLMTATLAQFQSEKVGNPSTNTIVSAYTGWVNQGILTFSGNADVQTLHPSNNADGSGGGNVFFTNTPGKYFKISGFPVPYQQPGGISITFSIYNSQGTSLSDLIFEYTTDGVNYNRINYDTIIQANTWSFRRCSFTNNNFIVQNLQLRFRQNSSISQYRLDDVQIGYSGLLPLNLEKFSSLLKESIVELCWTGSSSSTKEKFAIEKSLDGNHFNYVNTINAKGTGTFNYQFKDPISSQKSVYYRLKMINDNGAFTYSKIILVTPTGSETSLIQKIFPIPAKEKLNIQIQSNIQEKCTISLSSVSGKLLLTTQPILNEGINNISINTSKLSSGHYILKVQTSSVTETKEITVVNQ